MYGGRNNDLVSLTRLRHHRLRLHRPAASAQQCIATSDRDAVVPEGRAGVQIDLDIKERDELLG